MKMAYVMSRQRKRNKGFVEMLGLNKIFNLHLFCAFLGVVMFGTDACAYSVKKTTDVMKRQWGVLDGSYGTGNDYGTSQPGGGDFILDGGVGKVKKGSYGDEYALKAVVATQIVEHGGLFCPKQIQCTNKRKKNWSHMEFYDLEGFSQEKCLWLCEDGYVGVGCAEQVAVTPAMTTAVKQVFSGVSIKTKGGRLDDTGAGISVFYAGTADKDRDRIVLLGLTNIIEHGAYALPIYLSCKEEGYKDNVSYIGETKVYQNIKPKLLCAEGYMPNSTQTACELVTAATLEVKQRVSESGKEFCTGWDEAKYDPTIHEIDLSGDCIRFLCRDGTKAFPGGGDFSCVECAGSIRGGQDTETGECVKCDKIGDVFVQSKNACEPAKTYTTSQLKYGGEGAKKPDVEDECWTEVDPSKYKKCVKGSETN